MNRARMRAVLAGAIVVLAVITACGNDDLQPPTAIVEPDACAGFECLRARSDADLVDAAQEAEPTSCTATVADESRVRACVKAVACVPQHALLRGDLVAQNGVADAVLVGPAGFSLSDCLARDVIAPAQIDPINNALTCAQGDGGADGVATILNGERRAHRECGPFGESKPRCDGSRLVICSPARPQAIDCAKLGIGVTCATEPAGGAVAAGCRHPGTSSVPMVTQWTCNGTRLIGAIAGSPFLWGIDCAALGPGITCVSSPAIGATCSPLRPTCNPGPCQPPPVTCADAGPTACQPGFTCSGDSRALCLSVGCPLTDALACRESCSGSLANLCVGGARVAIDCAKYGRRCTIETSVDLAGDRAMCTPLEW